MDSSWEMTPEVDIIWPLHAHIHTHVSTHTTPSPSKKAVKTGDYSTLYKLIFPSSLEFSVPRWWLSSYEIITILFDSLLWYWPYIYMFKAGLVSHLPFSLWEVGKRSSCKLVFCFVFICFVFLDKLLLYSLTWSGTPQCSPG